MMHAWFESSSGRDDLSCTIVDVTIKHSYIYSLVLKFYLFYNLQ